MPLASKSPLIGGALLLVACSLLNIASAQQVRVLVQSSPLAGFKYHQAALHWQALHIGDALQLIREPDNPHDANAVRVDWQGHALGYVPRRENAALAWAMDHDQRVSARISRLREDPNPRRRIEFEVFVE
jgi:hypothetical protein